MRHLPWLLFMGFVIGLSLDSVIAQSQLPPDVAKSKQAHEKKLSGTRERCSAEAREAKAEYEAAVESARKKMESRIAKAEAQQEMALSLAYREYLSFLRIRMKGETRNGELDRALAIRSERDAVQKSLDKISEKEEQPSGKSKGVACVEPPKKTRGKPRAFTLAAFAGESARLGETIQLTPADLKEDKEGHWIRVPEKLKKTRPMVYMPENKHLGASDFTVARSGWVILACNWSYQGNSSGDWTKERWTKNEFIKNGWRPIEEEFLGGKLINKGNRPQVLFCRYLNKGEKYRLRCNKYDPPYVIVAN